MTRLSWTQPICLPCWRIYFPHRTASAHAIKPKYAVREKCAFCGAETHAGLYVRQDPKTVPFPRTEDSPRHD